MEINKKVIESIIIMLYKLGEYDSCDSMIQIYKKYFVEENELH